MARNGAIACSFIVCVGAMCSTMLGYAGASRFIYSFARDGAFPPRMSRALSYVHPRTKTPLGAVLFYGAVCAAFTCVWLNDNPPAAFAAITGMNSNGLLLTYGIAPLLRLTSSASSFAQTADFNLKWLSVPAAVLGVVYALASNATIALPSFSPSRRRAECRARRSTLRPWAWGRSLRSRSCCFPLQCGTGATSARRSGTRTPSAPPRRRAAPQRRGEQRREFLGRQ